MTAKSQSFELGAGDWLFDLQVAHGFGSVTNSGPSTPSFFGAISVAVSIVDDAGSSVGTVTGTAQPVNPPQAATATGAGDQVKAARWTVVISIPEATIAANANKPVKGISIVLRRVNSDNPLIGQYNSDSGDLNVIAQSTNLILRKVS